MSVTICPTITADTPEEYLRQMELVETFAKRIHVDVTDGDFAVRKLVSFDQVWWRGNRTIDLHVMYRVPSEHAEIIIALRPRLVILHAESEGNFEWFASALRREGIEVGIALLQRTPAANILPALEHIDHVLIFSGHLGHQGGSEADLELLTKVKKIREAKPTIEIGWDGGVNAKNARRLAEGGIDVLNVGGFIQRSHDPQKAYATLEAEVAGL
jgi:pentose-5-phosphate-3-epimerase